MKDNRLASKEMARFVASGYLRFDEMVPKDLCAACLEEMREVKASDCRCGSCWVGACGIAFGCTRVAAPLNR